jgi:hypothetical protein
VHFKTMGSLLMARGMVLDQSVHMDPLFIIVAAGLTCSRD